MKLQTVTTLWLHWVAGATAQSYLRVPPVLQQQEHRKLQLQVVQGTLGGSSETILGKCQGDCDKDSDCQDGLQCFQRRDNEPVPGCYADEGIDNASKKGVDFCYDPNEALIVVPEAASPQALVTASSVESNGTSGATTTTTASSVNTVPTQSERSWAWAWTGGAGGTSNLVSSTTTDENTGLTPVSVLVGLSGTPTSKFQVCQGDCDSDAECADGLKCFQRSGTEDVPGCSEISASHWSIDFCYDPNFGSGAAPESSTNNDVTSELPSLVVVVGIGGQATRPLEECEGDCDSHNECASGLLCMERAGSEPVPGCTGVTAARSGIDFCYDPNKDENAKPIPASPVQSPTPAPVQPRPVPSPTVSAPVGAEGTTATGNCRQEQLDFSTCLTGKPLCRQCFAPILGQQLNCISLQEEVCTVLATDACECDRCSGVFKKYYDCVSDNVCSALTCDAGTIIDVPVAPTPTRAPVLPNSPTSSPVPEHDYKGSTMLKDVGDNEELTEKLGRCEGDCDTDDDCDSDLVCFQRTLSESTLVPGCFGTPTTDRDYCIDPFDNPSQINSDTFRIKLFWREGYEWQDEDRERPWCLQCDGSSCGENDILIIKECDDDNTRFNFINPSADSVQIKVANEDLCLEVISDMDRRKVTLENCDTGNIYQRFIAGEMGDFSGDRFELQPIARPGCLTQRHHPKDDEYIYLEVCEEARDDLTSFWNKY